MALRTSRLSSTSKQAGQQVVDPKTFNCNSTLNVNECEDKEICNSRERTFVVWKFALLRSMKIIQ